jgi:hypothetical protein
MERKEFPVVSSGLVLLNLKSFQISVNMQSSLLLLLLLCLMFCVVSLFNLSKLRPCAASLLALT